jgi:hypothetical protein
MFDRPIKPILQMIIGEKPPTSLKPVENISQPV